MYCIKVKSAFYIKYNQVITRIHFYFIVRPQHFPCTLEVYNIRLSLKL